MKIKDLNTKELLGALGYYNNNCTNITFTEFLSVCEKATDHSDRIIYYHNDSHSTTIGHGFYSLYMSEELEILEILRK